MALVDSYEGLLSFTQKGKFGLVGGFGGVQFGWSLFGYYEPLTGYYQKVRIKGEIKHRRLTPTWPSNPQTPAQQANRLKFANAISAWRLLTPEQVSEYNTKGQRKHMEGFNLFISQYMKTH
jgi:hypothetical protein